MTGTNSDRTENQGDAPTFVPFQRRRWYADLRFPHNGQDELRKGERCGIYLISSKPYVKIGIADDPARRFCEIEALNPHGLQMVRAYWVPKSIVRLTEAYCHAALAQFHHRGEWFKVDARIAGRAMHAVCRQAARSRGVRLEDVAFQGSKRALVYSDDCAFSARLLNTIPDFQPAPPP